MSKVIGRKIKETHYSDLPPAIQAELIEEMERQGQSQTLIGQIKSDFYLITAAFRFDKSAKGFDYWHGVYNGAF